MFPEGVPTMKTQTKMNIIVSLNNEKGLFHDPGGGLLQLKPKPK